MSNAQLPPQSASGADFVWLYLRFDGRIGREVYWLSILLQWCVLVLVIAVLVFNLGEEGASGPALLLAIASMWCEMAILVKRQHDWGLPWYWCLFAFVPVAGVVWMIACGVVKSHPGPNGFGPRTNAPAA
jgi:uncharacterized membrane protein YhaH (DUF805 family)